jgi:hypothetical protein
MKALSTGIVLALKYRWKAVGEPHRGCGSAMCVGVTGRPPDMGLNKRPYMHEAGSG